SFDSFPFSLWTGAFQARGLKLPRNVVKTPSLLAQMGLPRTGQFVTILPRTMIHFGGPHLRKIIIDLPPPPYPVDTFTLKHRAPNPITPVFINCAREVAKPFLSTKRPRQ